MTDLTTRIDNLQAAVTENHLLREAIDTLTQINRRYVVSYLMTNNNTLAVSNALGFVEADTFDEAEKYIRDVQVGQMIAYFALSQGGITDCGVAMIHCVSKEVRNFTVLGTALVENLEGKSNEHSIHGQSRRRHRSQSHHAREGATDQRARQSDIHWDQSLQHTVVAGG